MKKMTTLVLATFVLVACVFSMPQVNLKKQAFNDIGFIFRQVEIVEKVAFRLHHLIGEIEALKTEILDDVDRKKALKVLVDLHPDYDIVDIEAKINKLSTLKTWLKDNGFVGGN